MKLERILVVDDESSVRGLLTELLREMDYTALGVESIAQARTALKEESFDLVISDLKLRDGSGLEFLRSVRASNPQLNVMLITGYGSIDSAVEALRIGIFDYLVKPVDTSRLAVALDRLREVMALQSENHYLRGEVAARQSRLVSWGKCPAMLRVKQWVERLGGTDATVLIQGESGTGKEVVAQALHEQSSRNGKPFIRVNCAAIPANLLESEFFGHEKGSFTGAIQRREGRFELANGGTLLLDEISEIPPDLQVKLLRVLQEREFERVGGNKTIKVDVRVIATTNRDLQVEVRQGRFREDLYYRLNVVPIQLPPLRERGDDVVALAEVFMAEFARKHGKSIRRLGKEAVLHIKAYSWPGNVRELQNALERAVILSADDEVLGVEDLPPLTVEGAGTKGPGQVLSLADIEREAIIHALQRCGGNRTHASKLLGISLRTLRNKLALYRKHQKIREVVKYSWEVEEPEEVGVTMSLSSKPQWNLR